jgi:molybdopterin-guanine dinucleotide biosynthesis protein B
MPDLEPAEKVSLILDTPILGIVGFSGSGKTTLLAKLITELNILGIRIGIIKHAHHHFDIDHPGKDSYILRHAGAKQTLVASKHRWALTVETAERKQDPQLAELISRLDLTQLDLVLVEGFKHVSYPKLEVHRAAANPVLLCPDDPDIIALLTTEDLQVKSALNLPVLNLNDTICIVQFIMDFIRKQHD